MHKISQRRSVKTKSKPVAIFLLSAFISILSRPAFSDDATETKTSPAPEKSATSTITSNREIVKTLTVYYINQQKFINAEKYLSEHLNGDPDDAEGWRLYGLTLGRMGEWEKAQTAFNTAADLTEGVDKGTNLYLLADIQVRSGQPEAGKTTLNKLKIIPELAGQVEDAKLTINSQNSLPPLDLERGKMQAEAVSQNRIRYAATFTTGYDTNVLLLPDFATGLSPSSPFFAPGLQASYVYSLGGGSFSATGVAGYTSNLSTDAMSYNSLPVGLGLEWKVPGNLGLSITNQNNVTFLNSAGLNLFSWGTSLGLKKNIFQSQGQSLDLAVPVTYNNYPGAVASDPNFVRDGFVISPELSHRHTLGQFSIAETGSYQRQAAQGANFRSNTYVLSINALTQLPHNIFLLGTSGFTRSLYPDSDIGRADSKFNLGIEASKKITVFVPMIANLGIGWEKNNSSVDLASYEKRSISLKVSYAF